MTSSTQGPGPSFILASGSPRRATLLPKLGFSFDIVPSQKPELYDDNEQPAKIVQRLAAVKTRDVASQFTDAIILGADTLVTIQHDILGKPENKEQAVAMLQKLSDAHHQVWTGVSLVKTNTNAEITNTCQFVENTEVQFGKLDPADIKEYVASGEPMDKAGAYGIQDDWGARFVAGIEGDYYNVMGLPLHTVYVQLKEFAPELF